MKKAVTTLLMLTAFSYLYHAKSKDMVNIQEEIWKDIAGYEGLYQISTEGQVKNIKKRKNKKLIKNWAGYLRVQLSSKNKGKIFSIHRLVAIAFINNPKNHPEVNHIDHNRENNNFSNLEWCTRSYNAKHSFTRSDRVIARAWLGKSGALHPMSKQVIQKFNGVEIARFDSQGEAARVLSIRPSGISRCCVGNRKSYKGFIWQFV